jgi:hypothetical protein
MSSTVRHNGVMGAVARQTEQVARIKRAVT